MQALKPTTLDQLRPGQSARVLRVEGDDAIANRLMDMGFWPGTRISVKCRALFGGPLACFLQGYRLALRRSEAARIIVTAAASFPDGGGSGAPARSGRPQE